MFHYFVSYASDDREPFVINLIDRLKESGLNIWFDQDAINLGDSIIGAIQAGLKQSQAALIILSAAYIEKRWTKEELNSILQNEELASKTIPIFHNISQAEVAKHLPLIADRLGMSSALPMRDIIVRLHNRAAMEPLVPPLSEAKFDTIEQIFKLTIEWLHSPKFFNSEHISGRTIFHVEDNERFADLIKRFLEHEFSANVVIFPDSRSAHLAAEISSVDLMILDQMLPGENGIKTAWRFRRNGAQIPYIFLTAYVFDGHNTPERYYDFAHAAYLCKPCDLSEMARRIGDIVSPRGVYAALRNYGVHGVAAYRVLADCRERIIEIQKKTVPLLREGAPLHNMFTHKLSHEVRHLISDIVEGISTKESLQSRQAIIYSVMRLMLKASAFMGSVSTLIKNYASDVHFGRANATFKTSLTLVDKTPLASEMKSFIGIALLELIDNALQSTPGPISVSIRSRRLLSEKYLIMSVENDGPMIDNESVERIFEPGFTTKKGSTGLGLSHIRSVAAAFKCSVVLSQHNPVVFILKVPIPD